MTHLLSYPLQYWHAGGILLLPLVPVCFGIWFYFMRTRRTIINATTCTSRLTNIICEQGRSAVKDSAHPLAPILLQASHDRLAAVHSFDEESSRLSARLKKDIIILTALTAAAPLLGLLGTVTGMMQTFSAVAATSADTAARVAAGVSRALITTQAGLVIAIPGVFGLARIKRIAHHFQVELSNLKLHALLLEDG